MDITKKLDERLLVGWAELGLRAQVETAEDLEEGKEETEEEEMKIEWYNSDKDT